MLKKYWIKCPICNGKTRVQVFHNTVLKDFTLFCTKFKLTHIIDVEKLEIVIKNTEKQTFTQIIHGTAVKVAESHLVTVFKQNIAFHPSSE